MPYKDPEQRRLQRKRHYQENKEKYAARREAWKAANPEKHAAIVKAWHEANPERVAEHKKKYADNNKRKSKPDPVKAAAAVKAWQQRNPDSVRAAVVNRRASRLQRTPKWFGEFDSLVMREASDLAAKRQSTTRIRWHVDHIIPLRGDCVSGLHVWQNIQVVPAAFNQSKNANFTGTPLNFWPVTDNFQPVGV